MRSIVVTVVGMLLAACTLPGSSSEASTTSTSGATSTTSTTTAATRPRPATATSTTSTTTAPTSTTTAATTNNVVATTTTTTRATTTTTADPPPAAVTELSVGIGAGSGEIDVVWRRNAEADVDHYEVWRSEQPGASKALVDTVPHDPGLLGGRSQDLGDGRTLYVDVNGWSWDPGTNCYRVRAVDRAGAVGPFSAEACLPDPAPGRVGGLTVGVGGGSLEIGVIWRRNGEADVDHYEVWWSEQPGQAKTFLVTVPDDPSQLGGRTQDYGDGWIGYIDYPRDWIDGTNCYQVAAVDRAGQVGPRSEEVCFQP